MAKITVAAAYASYAAHSDVPGVLDTMMQAVLDYAHTITRRKVSQQADRDEIAQDAVIRVWQALEAYDPSRSSFRTWCHRLILAASVDHYRKVARRAREHELWDGLIEMAEPLPSSLLPQIRQAAGKNAPLVDLVLTHGDIAEAARQSGLSVRGAKQRLRRVGRNLETRESVEPASDV